MRILRPSLFAGIVLTAGPALATDPAAEARGQKLFQDWCATCHAPDAREDGKFLPGTESLQEKYKGAKPAALEQRKDLTVAYVELVIRRGTRAMPQFRKTEISDQQMHDIAAYLAKGNGAPHADAHSFLDPYFGNTFISHHSDGVEYRMLYSADGRFHLTRSGGPDRSADYELSGTYTVEGDQVCFQPPPDAFKCVPQDQGHKAGDSWQVAMPDGGTATHMIISGVAAPVSLVK
jgi:mono/diheme cytochrome c family protein